MNHLLDTDTDSRADSHSTGDREISLGTPTILGIFFALALICAAFFGFGYSLGRKSAQNTAIPTGTVTNSPSITIKPAAGSVAGQPAQVVPVAAPVTPATVTIPVAASNNGATPADAMIVGDKLPPGAQQSATSPAAAFMVQIAAVSSQEIADIELAALKKDGYDVVIRHEPQDQLLHIQIGPFATRKDAEAMQANVQAHGFNAYIPK